MTVYQTRAEGRAALVTGGSRGIGRAIATTLAARGHAVALTYLSRKDEARPVVQEITQKGGRVIALRMAVEDRQNVRQVVAEARAALGPITVLVNNAAMAQEKPFLDLTDEDWDRVLAANLRGPFACCQEVLPDMLAAGWGRIVNISSIGSQLGGVNQVHYACAKAGLNNLTRSLARLYSAQGIRTNTVSPGLVPTDMTARDLATAASQERVRNIPVGRTGTTEEIANVVAFLVSDEASYITGQTINVNGGAYLG